MTIKEQYFQAVAALYAKIRETQNDKIAQAAHEIAGRVAQGSGVHLYDTGHLIDSEFMNRAGGFNLFRRFKYSLQLDSKARVRDIEKDRNAEGLAAVALRAANVYPGDVMIIGSVSGKTPQVIDLALECKKLGVYTIALTSITYSSQLESEHSSHLHLYEVADLVIDNCAPYGDAMLTIEGCEQPFIPASGLAAAYILWAMNADLLEDLLARGLKPGILGSVNYPENRKYNEDLEDLYLKTGL